MNLNQILAGIKNPYTVKGDKDIEINHVSLSSKKCQKGSCFFAVNGNNADGHDFINDAISNGAVCVVCQILPEFLEDGVTYILTDDSSLFIGPMASNFYGNPSNELKIIGITGTNGKTTIATMVYKMLIGFMRKTALLSTNGDLINDQEYEFKRLAPTTPDAIFIQKFFKDALDAGCQYVVMEVSSHSVVQHRINGINFTGAVFTNLSHDHLDYHHTIENYALAKKGFFDMLSNTAFAVINIDDNYGRYMVLDSHAKIVTYGFNGIADYSTILESKLVGHFNEYNTLAVYAVGMLLGFESNNIKNIIKDLTVRGRFELVYNNNSIKVIVDYAHTPDGMQNVLETARDLVPDGGRLITIMGCGGDRDVTKRPVMGRLAYDLSDIVIITSDNPRTEDPEKIISEIKQGLPESLDKDVFAFIDRKDAIVKAKEISKAKDVIMLLGKGHETYQEINGVKNHFDDREIVIQEFRR
jgi:UDP-N-acetylmuramoyl-L-alanyl-D-glutamate--2,6-diaminopimelate ligase